MRPVLFHLGPITIWSYGVALMFAFIGGAWFAARRAERAGIKGDYVWNCCTWIFLVGLFTARMLHIVFERPELLTQPLRWFRVWEGGLVFYGAFLAAVVVVVVYARLKKIELGAFLDAFVPSVAIGHLFVRIGCFMNGCCYGKPASWGIVFPNLNDGVPRHPTQFYEAAYGLALFGALLLWEKRAQRVKGELVCLYAGGYGLFRFFLEFARGDYRGGSFLGMSPSQVIGLTALLVGIVGFLAIRMKACRSRSQ